MIYTFDASIVHLLAPFFPAEYPPRLKLGVNRHGNALAYGLQSARSFNVSIEDKLVLNDNDNRFQLYEKGITCQ